VDECIYEEYPDIPHFYSYLTHNSGPWQNFTASSFRHIMSLPPRRYWRSYILAPPSLSSFALSSTPAQEVVSYLQLPLHAYKRRSSSRRQGYSILKFLRWTSNLTLGQIRRHRRSHTHLEVWAQHCRHHSIARAVGRTEPYFLQPPRSHRLP
jgi:hypothetical protein